MKSILRRSVVLASLALMAFAPVASANHPWSTYHWANTSGEVQIYVIDNVNATWDPHLDQAIADWNASAYLQLTEIAGAGGASTCNPVAGRVNVCNFTYGSTGWLGLAQIWLTTGNHISQGTAKLNDTYHNSAPYNTDAWRDLVMCQEVGHTFGLGHQDENNGNTNLGTCMDYTSYPAGGGTGGSLSNLAPNSHDYSQLASIYNHFDSFNSSSSNPGKGGAAAANINWNNPSEWGQLIASENSSSTYSRTLADGTVVLTNVIWAE